MRPMACEYQSQGQTDVPAAANNYDSLFGCHDFIVRLQDLRDLSRDYFEILRKTMMKQAMCKIAQ
jgi:hypothetical protein